MDTQHITTQPLTLRQGLVGETKQLRYAAMDAFEAAQETYAWVYCDPEMQHLAVEGARALYQQLLWSDEQVCLDPMAVINAWARWITLKGKVEEVLLTEFRRELSVLVDILSKSSS